MGRYLQLLDERMTQAYLMLGEVDMVAQKASNGPHNEEGKVAMFIFLHTYKPTIKQRGKRTLVIGLKVIKMGGGLSHLAIIKTPKKQTNSSTPLPQVTWELWKLHLT